MPVTKDARFESSAKRIRDALAGLLRTKPLMEVTVSELARSASVSRATFYAHYGNLNDVYEELVAEVMSDVRTFSERFCSESIGCSGEGKPLYCDRIRSEQRYAGVIREVGFFPAMMAFTWEDLEANADAAAKGIDQGALRALRLFQMSGCHAVATSEFAERSDWEHIRQVIDIFIDGGMRAVEEMHI